MLTLNSTIVLAAVLFLISGFVIGFLAVEYWSDRRARKALEALNAETERRLLDAIAGDPKALRQQVRNDVLSYRQRQQQKVS